MSDGNRGRERIVHGPSGGKLPEGRKSEKVHRKTSRCRVQRRVARVPCWVLGPERTEE